MFVRESYIVKLFKNAYKGIGLRIANTGDGLVMTGRAWYMFIYQENLPKEVLGEIIKLTGKLPEKGCQILYSKDGGEQTELFLSDPCQDVYKRATEAQAEGIDAWNTDIIITDPFEKSFRVYKTENDAFAIPEGIRIMISTEYCEENEEMYGCFADDGWLYWVSNYMAFGYPAFTANDEIRARAVKLHAAGII